MASTTPSTTLSRSASSKTMKGDLPPSSSESFLPEPAVARRMLRPTSVEPVKAILFTSGWRTRASPTWDASPVTMLTTPGGRPTSSMISANLMAVSDVYVAGCLAPCFKGSACGGNRGIDIGAVGCGYLRQRFAGRGIDAVKILTTGGLDPAVVDEQAERRVFFDPCQRGSGGFGSRAVFH